MSSCERKAWAVVVPVLCAVLSGCGTPGAPQPPSLNLPDPVTDLTATRAGDKVTLQWTNPKRNTDRTAVKSDVTARVCRREGAGACIAVGLVQTLSAGKPGRFEETLPPPLASGMPRPVSYFVELLNRKGRSAGLSNAGTVVSGAAPRAVEGLAAQVRKDGVVLTWTPDGESSALRLQRKLLTAPAQKPKEGSLASAPEAAEQNLLVEAAAEKSRAIDKTARFGEKYEYRAQRVNLVEVDGKRVELAGEFSPPVDVAVEDVFPPAVPSGLAAVATAGENGAGPAVDLSWQPNTEADLEGYIVYRREEGGKWRRISAEPPVLEPAFHDTQVQAGHTYEYTVSAIDQGGHESGRSAEAQDTVPQ